MSTSQLASRISCLYPLEVCHFPEEIFLSEEVLVTIVVYSYAGDAGV